MKRIKLPGKYNPVCKEQKEDENGIHEKITN